MIQRPGRQPTRGESLAKFYEGIVPTKHLNEQIIVHHVTEDSHKRVQLEVERRHSNGIEFERIVL